MSKPVIAIVGRPNVGKSTLFNKLIGERRAIVEDIPGVTRDRIYGETEWRGRTFSVIDTGGIEPKTEDLIMAKMRMQAEIAIESADVSMFLCGMTPSELEDRLGVRIRFSNEGRGGAGLVNAILGEDEDGTPLFGSYGDQ